VCGTEGLKSKALVRRNQPRPGRDTDLKILDSILDLFPREANNTGAPRDDKR